MTTSFALEIEKISKAYGANKVLQEIAFKVRRGTAHALLGENGAGKSTTIKLISGAIAADSGFINLNGSRITLRNPRDAYQHRIATAFQELTLVPDLTVVQNIIMPFPPRGFGGQLKNAEARKLVRRHLDDWDLRDIDLDCAVRTLSLSQKQKLEITRALYRNPQLLLLDEATSSLPASDMEWFRNLVKRLREREITTIFITHRMAEVREFCDEVTVLRGGKTVGTFEVKSVSDEQLVQLIIGRSLESAYPERSSAPSDKIALKVQNLAAGGRLKDCAFALRSGEILGIAALQGMGQSELFQTLFGVLPKAGGLIEIDGKPTVLNSPSAALSNGIGYVPEERKTEGLFLALSGRENISSVVLGDISTAGMLNSGEEKSIAVSAMGKVEVTSRAMYTRVSAFSGGNQQKIIMAKWLNLKTRILLLYDPCRGVDVGTKFKIYTLMRDYAAKGGSIIIYSTELPELIGTSDRVLALYDGRVNSELDVRAMDQAAAEASIMNSVLGN